MAAPEPALRRLHQRAALRRGRALVPACGEVDELVRAVGEQRNRPIRVLAVPLTGSAPSGAWIPMVETDYLLHPAGASPTRRAAVLCHELGHILLGHQAAFHASMTTELLGGIAPTLKTSTAAAILFRKGYTNREEAAAEYTGTLLLTDLEARRQALAWEGSSRLSTRLR